MPPACTAALAAMFPFADGSPFFCVRGTPCVRPDGSWRLRSAGHQWDGPAASGAAGAGREPVARSGSWRPIYKFAIATRKKGELQLVVGAASVPWHQQTLPNLKKYNNTTELKYLS
jgi:hypothetical protein